MKSKSYLTLFSRVKQKKKRVTEKRIFIKQEQRKPFTPQQILSDMSIAFDK